MIKTIAVGLAGIFAMPQLGCAVGGDSSGSLPFFQSWAHVSGTIARSGPLPTRDTLVRGEKPFPYYGAYGYLVFRHANPQIAAGAGTCAKMMFDIHKSGGNLGYTVLGALGSLFGGSGTAASRTEMDALLDRILAGKTHRFFCSQFVVYVYQFVGEQCGQPASSFFNFADAKVPPSTLAQALNGNGKFNEVGYMIGGER